MAIIPNFGYNLINGFIFICFISFIVTSYSYYNVNNSKNINIIRIKNQEKRLSIYNLFYLYFIRYIHYIICVLGLFFIIIFRQNIYLDIFYIVFFFIIFYNIFRLGNECPLNYVEKNILDNNYVFNLDNDYIPMYTVLFGSSDTFKIKNVVMISIIVILTSLFKQYYLPNSKINIRM
jgi:hypothetical protein